ncbi:MAG: hypothetical protein IJS61_00185 [Firmicutes bacterium]|nr:hypothetical protein [Bacillota bacterium]
MTNELLFYGGIAICVSAVVLELIFIICHIIKKIKLSKIFDKEYGREE